MTKAIKGILSSKKAFMAILSGVVWLVGKVGYDLDTEELAGAVGPLWMYILGQGIADHGKGKEEAKLAAEASPEPSEPEEEPSEGDSEDEDAK